jgi:hypothetical protein
MVAPQTVYNEIIEDTPIAVTTTIAAKRLVGEAHPYKYVLSYLVRVRSMGTATYIALGDEYSQQSRLITAGQTVSYSCNRYEVIDLTKKWIKCDTADAVVEVMCTYLPLKQYGSVRKVS